MIQQTPKGYSFKEQLCASLVKETLNLPSYMVSKSNNIYSCGDLGESVYFIEKGQVKLVMFSASGQECMLAARTTGDIFGELCLSELGVRGETVTAMEDTVLKEISSDQFLLCLEKNKLLEGFVRHMAMRVDEQQQIIANLIIAENEQKLGQVLLELARTIGQKDPRSIIIKLYISHEELSNMIGTTVNRVNLFIQRFCNLGLIEISEERFFIIKEKKLVSYLAEIS